MLRVVVDRIKVAAPLAENHHGADASGSWKYTVLYAPTREGFFACVVLEGAVDLAPIIGSIDDPGVEEHVGHYRAVGSERKITQNDGDKLVCKKSKRVAVEVP